tara:strand:- start:1837 stop:2904 length:1068 start_codon:yes stop_codon:yes gene_type:complete
MKTTTLALRGIILGFTAKITLVWLFLTAAAVSSAQPSWMTDQFPDDYKVPRTEWGHPDLQGLFTNEINPGAIPMERPEELGNKAYYTDADIRAIEANAAQTQPEPEPSSAAVSAPPVGEDVGGYNAEIWGIYGIAEDVLSTRQTSLIIDPPNGRAPIRESAWQIRQYKLEHVADDYVNLTVWDRCLTRGVPGTMLPGGYNNALRIIQTPDHIAISHEMIHETRIIPLNKSDHIDEKIRLWMGDSVAHWEDDTLVIETVNFNDKTEIANSSAGGRLRGLPAGKDQHLVERFTRLSEDTIIWEGRITSPESFTQPITIALPLTLDPSYDMYEYACHEGNHAMSNILRGGRARDAATP